MKRRKKEMKKESGNKRERDKRGETEGKARAGMTRGVGGSSGGRGMNYCQTVLRVAAGRITVWYYIAE